MENYFVEQYNLLLFLFAICIALITSYIAFELLSRRIDTHFHLTSLSLWISSLTLGIGTWTFHFIGMLSYKPIVESNYYDFIQVIASLIFAIVCCYLAFYVLSHQSIRYSTFFASFLLGTGFSFLHFIGMKALYPSATVSHDMKYIVLAGFIALLGSYYAFHCLSQYRSHIEISKKSTLLKVKSSLIMGSTIVTMHYTAIYGISHILQASKAPLTLTVDALMLGVALGFGTLFLLLLVFIASVMNERFAIQSNRLKRNEQDYQSLFNHNPDLVITLDLEGRFLSVNQVIELYGYNVEELLHKPFAPFIVPDQLEKVLEHFRTAANGIAVHYESAFFSKQGDRIKIGITNIPIIIDGEIVGVYGVIKDITDYKQAQNALVEAEAKYRSLVEESVVGIFIIQDGQLVYVNPQFVQLSGYTYEELMGSRLSQYIHPDDLSLVEGNIEKQLKDGFSGIRYQYRAIKKDQSMAYFEVLGSKTLFNGRPAITGSVMDITEQKRAEERIQYLAYHDALTGLYNRNQVLDCLQSVISHPMIKHAAVLFMDLDRFKLVNDTLGHAFGDQLLIEVSKRLTQCILTKDCLARYGGDEFILVLPCTDFAGASRFAKDLLECLEESFLINDYEIFVTPSIGISLYPQNGLDCETLIRKADLALHQAKRLGKNNFQFYNDHSLKVTHEIFEMEKGLRYALEREEFVVYYQPQVNNHSGEIIGLEALIRWNHPDKGIIPPAHFIPIAEETGLIIPIGEWIIRKACTQMKRLHEDGFPLMVVSVNLSMRQFFQPNLVQMIRGILEETQLLPEYLELEITESMMVDSLHALKVVQDLKKLGVKVSLDDFGTGYSSLHYLKKFPIDRLKIDQSFIRDCLIDENDATLVKTIISMAQQLKLEVIAEGIETKEQLIFLQQIFCHEAQGYLFSPPLAMEELQVKLNEIGQLVNQLGVPQEIRDQKWMEEALRLAQQELQDTVRQQYGMTFKFKKEEGRFIHTLIDGELLYRLGLVPEQIIGKDLYEIHPPEIAEEILESYQRAWNGEENVSFEREHNSIYYLAYLRPIRRGGHVTEVIVSCVDITERKRIDEALRWSEARYRLIAENTLDLIRVLDVDGVIQYASPSHERVLGFSPEHIQGKSIFEWMHPDEVHLVKQTFTDMIVSTAPCKRTFRQKHANGHWIDVETQWTSVQGENGEVEQIVAVLRDLTERKQTEEVHCKSDGLASSLLSMTH